MLTGNQSIKGMFKLSYVSVWFKKVSLQLSGCEELDWMRGRGLPSWLGKELEEFWREKRSKLWTLVKVLQLVNRIPFDKSTVNNNIVLHYKIDFLKCFQHFNFLNFLTLLKFSTFAPDGLQPFMPFYGSYSLLEILGIKTVV